VLYAGRAPRDDTFGHICSPETAVRMSIPESQIQLFELKYLYFREAIRTAEKTENINQIDSSNY
jgi:hypothetical protein